MTRVAFAGGKPIGVACLGALVEHPNVEIVGVFVNPEDHEPTHWYGRTTVGSIARAAGVPVYDRLTPKRLASLSPDLLVVAYFDRILGRRTIAVPSLGCVNVHLALAEEYRGCYPTTWALIDGKRRYGVTIHYIDEGIDTGDVIAQRSFTIRHFDTGGTLYCHATNVGAALFRDTLPLLLSGKALRRKQVTTAETRYRQREFPSHELDFTGSGQDVYNRIRAMIFPPFPMPYLTIAGTRYELREVAS